MLKCETNTKAMGKRVLSAARKVFGRRDHLSSVFEHGQWWIDNLTTGAQWSVIDCERNGIDGFDFEQITFGKGE